MVLPELDVEKVKRWCRDRVPAKFADEVRLEVTARGKSVSIHECRPIWRGAPGEWSRPPIAQIRYQGDGTWTMYSDLGAHQPIDVILGEIGIDPACIFWG
jgi:hypothetical protein